MLLFLCGKKTTLRLRKQYFKPEARILKSIIALGTTGFVMNASNGAVQIACNATLKSVGGVMLGDMYIGIMTALNSPARRHLFAHPGADERFAARHRL